MIQNLIIPNPITLTNEIWNIDIFELDYFRWNQYITELIGNSNEMAFNYYLDSLNPQVYNNKLYFDTSTFTYIDIIVKYFRRLYTITNYFEYNYWFNKLINKIQDNLIFEYEFKTNHIMKEGPIKKTVKKQSIPNKWIKHETENLFDGKSMYLYENLKTGEQIESENPNILEELNAPKKKIKKQKIINVTFNFNKK